MQSPPLWVSTICGLLMTTKFLKNATFNDFPPADAIKYDRSGNDHKWI